MNGWKATTLVLSAIFLILGVAMALTGEATAGCILAGAALIAVAIQAGAGR
jgi:hypothetical protein